MAPWLGDERQPLATPGAGAVHTINGAHASIQCPKGAFPIRRLPLAAHLAQVSSMNTSRCRSTRPGAPSTACTFGQYPAGPAHWRSRFFLKLRPSACAKFHIVCPPAARARPVLSMERPTCTAGANRFARRLTRLPSSPRTSVQTLKSKYAPFIAAEKSTKTGHHSNLAKLILLANTLLNWALRWSSELA